MIEHLLQNTESEPSPASPKQLKFIANLAEKAGLDESSACALVELKSYSELKGGRNGSASTLINELKKAGKKGK